MSVGGRPQIPPGPFLVVGLARSGVAAARALAARGARVIGLDAGSRQGAQELREHGVELHLGGAAPEGLMQRVGAVIKSPGVPAQHAVVAHARGQGIPVLGELELGWRLLVNEFVAVTGTNGKTTTVEMIAHVLRGAGVQAVTAGNVGTAVCSLVGALGDDVTVVCEVSSFQLEDAVAFAPETAVLLNVSADHLDRHGSLAAYEAAKLKIFAVQSPTGTAVLPAGMIERVASAIEDERAPARHPIAFGASPRARMQLREGVMWWGEERLLAPGELRVRGAHNVENAMAAAAACLSRGVAADAVREGLRSFNGVAHRLEDVATRDGVLYVNDSKATNVSSALVALDAFAGRRVHLIAGGQAKGQEFTPMRGPVNRTCAAVYLIGEDAAAIARELEGVGVPLRACGELETALAACEGAARPGEVVLLSPACASFDQFADFQARGERFRALVLGSHAGDRGEPDDGGLRERASK